jgi:two-component system NtrC family sensor kinase
MAKRALKPRKRAKAPKRAKVDRDLKSKLAKLKRELAEALQRQTAATEVLEIISRSSGDLEPIFQKLLENATRLCGAQFGIMNLISDGMVRQAAFYNLPPSYTEAWLNKPYRPHAESVMGTVARLKQTVHVDDLRTRPAYRQGDTVVVALSDIAGARSYVGVPMLRDGELIGMISIFRQEVRPFTARQVELIKNFAHQAVIAIENARLLSEQREALEQQTATSDVLEVISRSAFDLKPVFETVAESSVKLCGSERALIYRFDGELLRLAAAFNAPDDLKDWIERNPIRPGRHSVAARVALERRAVQVVDVLADPEHTYGAKDVWPFRTVLGVPMLKGDDLLGVIVVYHNEVRPFTDRHIALVETFADQAVIAIENVRLFDEVQARTEDLREALQQQTATADVLKVISRSTFDLQAVLQTLVESAAKLCEADKATITRQKDGVFYRAENYGFSDEFMNYVRNVPVVPDRGSATGRALLEGVVVHIPDVEGDPDYTFNEAQRLGDFRTMLGVPMLREGVPVGVIVLTRSEPRPFTNKQIELVTTFADQAAIAIENVRLFDEVQTRTKELATSLDELRTAQDRLVQTEKLASLGQLTAGIAHEIKNPLNFVNNFSALSAELIDEMKEALSDISLDNNKREELNEIAQMLKSNLEKVVQHGKRADSIVKNMLQHSREGSGEHRPADINGVVDESLNLAYHGARAEKAGFTITLERNFDVAVGMVDVYPQEITRVLLNLISNGFYATAKRRMEAGDGFNPTLSAATKNLGDRVEIRIRDNGTGIPTEAKEKIFNPFFTTKPPGEGTGLGLSMSHDIIVKQHGGSIDVETEPGQFTEFKIVLPRIGRK